jgi:hypothetical protein
VETPWKTQWFSCEFPLNFPLSQAIGWTFVARRGMSCPLKEVVGTSAILLWAPVETLDLHQGALQWTQDFDDKHVLASVWVFQLSPGGTWTTGDILNGHWGLFNSWHSPFAISRDFS